MRKLPLIASALAICALSGVAAWVSARPAIEGWREIAWPFPRDGWPAGRAFRCDAVLCGGEIELYVRPKIGFCNCDNGVADDDEVDRVADVDLISERFDPVEQGKAIEVAGMKGRLRSYRLQMAAGPQHAAVGMAVSRRCDLLVASAHGKGEASEVRRVALSFLGRDDMERWIKTVLDGR
ncbi:hypothetical protein [Bradyrhizobium sp.]|jgi:hypothetical protein|uniref:hypothetical protein n=1 Tax=Bradyrhizobium sp. TaxID=376 RepID=UPI002E08CC63|nr:hypothetical protein [Bradyrhizobium sp.]